VTDCGGLAIISTVISAAPVGLYFTASGADSLTHGAVRRRGLRLHNLLAAAFPLAFESIRTANANAELRGPQQLDQLKRTTPPREVRFFARKESAAVSAAIPVHSIGWPSSHSISREKQAEVMPL